MGGQCEYCGDWTQDTDVDGWGDYVWRCATCQQEATDGCIRAFLWSLVLLLCVIAAMLIFAAIFIAIDGS